MKQSTRRLLAHGSNATLVTVFVVAALALAYLLADRWKVRVDLSEGASNTLSDELLGKLRLLDQDGIPVRITAFTNQEGREDTPFKDRAMRDLLREVGEQGRVVEWRLVDYDRERLTAERLGVREYGHVVVQRGDDRVDIRARELFRRAGRGRDRRLEFVGEAALSRAFSQLMSRQRQAVYVLRGHGELDPEDHGPDGLSDLVERLDRERYDVDTLDLARTDREGGLPEIPDDAAVLVVARPLRPLQPQVEDALLGWLAEGGPLLLALDVGLPVPTFLERLGVSIPEGVALQPEMQVPYPDRPIAVVRSHPITDGIREDRLSPVLAHPAPVRLADPLPRGVRGWKLLVSTRGGWIDRGGVQRGGVAVYEPGIDEEGPVTYAAALELLPGAGIVRPGRPAARIVVTGDADMFTNALLNEGPGNLDFAVDTIHWLARQDRRLGVVVASGRATAVRRLALTREQLGSLRLVTLGLMPVLVALVGAGVWTTRRGR